MKTVLPFFFRTKTIFIDDSIDYLTCLMLNPGFELMLTELFLNPKDALTHINLEKDSFSKVGVSENLADTFNHHISTSIGAFKRLIYVSERFKKTSVVVVDYEMLGMNGLQVCAAIKDPSIQKILLTGVANEQVAIDAFNQGLIQGYIRKNDKNVINLLIQAIHDAQYRYFSSLSASMTLKINSEGTIWNDPVLVDFFYQHMTSIGAVEFYLCERERSFLFMDAQGRTSRLYVANSALIDSVCSYARDHGASKDLLLALNNREKMLCYPEVEGEIPRPSKWQPYLYPAKRLQGRDLYCYAITPGMLRPDEENRIQSLNGSQKLENCDRSLDERFAS
ncbi:MAG: hypothetical protein WCK42_03910 [Myxococcaceae bacterium]